MEGIGGVPKLHSVYGSNGESAPTKELPWRRAELGIGSEIPVVAPADGELELGIDGGVETVGEGNGGEVEGDVERRGDAGRVRERAPSRPGRVRGGARAQGVGCAGGFRCSHYLRVHATRWERSQAHSVQVCGTVFVIYLDGSDSIWAMCVRWILPWRNSTHTTPNTIIQLCTESFDSREIICIE